MTKQELLTIQSELLGRISHKCDDIIKSSEISPLDKNYKLAHGKAVGALTIMAIASDYFYEQFDELSKED